MFQRLVCVLSALFIACEDDEPCYLDLSQNQPPNDRILVDLQDIAYLSDKDGACLIGLSNGSAIEVDQTCDVVANTPCSAPSSNDLPGGG